MAKTIMIQGTASNAGKSIITAGLCRIFKQDGYKVAPFKSQNMALNSFVTENGLEIGRAQAMQAEASGIEPDVRMNPILLKPTSDKKSQIILNGKLFSNMLGENYFIEKTKLIPHITEAFDSLSNEYDIIVIEGAGSPVEINLKERDIVNMGLAKIVKSPVLIVGDIDRGGVFASFAGTLQLLLEDERELVKGLIINKFRGDISLLNSGIHMIEDITEKPIIGVVPYLDIDIDDEDSLSEGINNNKYTNDLIDIAIIRLPKISNFTDFNMLSYMNGVGIRYVKSITQLGNPDMIILPGSQNTIEDLIWLKKSGFESKIKKYASDGKPIFGIGSGFEMLCKKINYKDTIIGIDLLPYTVESAKNNAPKRVYGELDSVNGIFKELSYKEYEGYEIDTSIINNNIVNNGNIYGTYIHGIFDKYEISKVIINSLLNEKGISKVINDFDLKDYKESQYNKLADSLRTYLDMKYVYEIMGL